MNTNTYVMAAALAAGLGVAGCDPGDGGDGGPAGVDGGETGPGDRWLGFRSGDRLKLRLGVTPDGASEFLGWHDTMFDVECTFRRTPDGASRCVPKASTAGLFKDPSCTQPLAYPGSGTCDPRARYVLAVRTVIGDCDRFQEEVRVFEVGDRAYSGPVYSNTGNPDVCELLGNDQLIETVEVPASQFLAREIRIDD